MTPFYYYISNVTSICTTQFHERKIQEAVVTLTPRHNTFCFDKSSLSRLKSPPDDDNLSSEEDVRMNIEIY